MLTGSAVGYHELITELTDGRSGFGAELISNQVVVIDGDHSTGVKAPAADSNAGANGAISYV